jgi:hypothetical protein
MVDIMDLDREIEALRLGKLQAAPQDGALAILLQFREDVDERAVALLESRDDEDPDGLPLPPAAPFRRRGRHHRWVIIPVAGALLVASTGAAAALSGSPSAPLYPLHRLIFGNATSSSAPAIVRDLDAAQTLLDQASAEPYTGRAAALGQARTLLSDAHRLLPLAGSDAPLLSMRLSAELARLRQLEMPPPLGGTLPTTPPAPGGSESPAAPAAGSSDEASGGGTAEEDAATRTNPPSGESEGSETGGVPVVGQPVEAEPSDPAPTPVTTRSAWHESDDPPGSEWQSPEPRASGSTDR